MVAKNKWLVSVILMLVFLTANYSGCGGGGGSSGSSTSSDPTLLWAITSHSSDGFNSLNATALDSNYIYLAGEDRMAGENDARWRVEKRSISNGTLISSFGTAGVIVSNPSIFHDVARAITIDSSAMYVAGYDYSPGDDPQWRIEKRSLATGALITSFGSSGVITSNPTIGYGQEAPSAIAIDSSAMYVAGYDSSHGSYNYQWRIEKRSLTTGALITSFGSSGVITSNPSAYINIANGIAIDSVAMYVVGYDESPGYNDDQWRIEKRSLTDGSLITSFGTNGVITFNPTPKNDMLNALSIDLTYLYLVGSVDSLDYPGDIRWRIEKRSLSSGALISSFGTNGVIISNPTPTSGYGYEAPSAIAIDSSAMYVGGGQGYTSQGRIEKRSLTDGLLISSFGAGGVINPVECQSVNTIAIDSSAIYIGESDYYYRVRIEKRQK